MDRRAFIKLFCTAVFFLSTQAYSAGKHKCAHLKKFNIQFPPWLIHPDRKQLNPKIKLEEIGLYPKYGYIKFLNEKPVHIDYELTPAQLLKSNNNVTNRTYMLLKRVLSYSIYKKTEDIDKFQDQETIDNMSLNDLVKLIVR